MVFITMKKNNSKLFIKIPFLYILFLLFFFDKIIAQEKPPPITINGTSQLFGQLSSRQGNNQEIPRNFLRWNFNNNLTFYGLPFDIGFFISTEQSKIRQSINNFSFSFNSRRYINSKKLRQIKFFTLFPTLELGTCRPNYTSLTLSGIALKGVNIEFTPGNFYLAFAHGKTKKAIQKYYPEKSTYKQKLSFGKIGWGKKDLSHIYFSILHSIEDKNSIISDTVISIRPRENLVASTDFNIVLFKKKFFITAEIAASLITRDIEAPEVKDENIPSFISNFVSYNISSNVDYAYNIKSLLKLKTTKISAGLKMVGPGFISFGTPYLRKDNKQYEIWISQSLSRKRISFQVFYKRMRDNLVNWKQTTTFSTTYGISGSIRLKKLPYLVFSYAPYHQENDNNETKLENKTSLFSISSVYSYKIGKARATTSLTFSNQNNKNEQDTIVIDTKNFYLSLSETVNFKFPLVISASAGLNSTELLNNKKNRFIFNINGTYGKRKKLRNTFGIRFSNQKPDKNKIGVFLRSIIPLWKFGELNIHFQQNIYKDNEKSDKEYNETLLSCAILMKW